MTNVYRTYPECHFMIMTCGIIVAARYSGEVIIVEGGGVRQFVSYYEGVAFVSTRDVFLHILYLISQICVKCGGMG